jgi:hypothetical protein
MTSRAGKAGGRRAADQALEIEDRVGFALRGLFPGRNPRESGHSGTGRAGEHDPSTCGLHQQRRPFWVDDQRRCASGQRRLTSATAGACGRSPRAGLMMRFRGGGVTGGHKCSRKCLLSPAGDRRSFDSVPPHLLAHPRASTCPFRLPDPRRNCVQDDRPDGARMRALFPSASRSARRYGRLAAMILSCAARMSYSMRRGSVAVCRARRT